MSKLPLLALLSLVQAAHAEPLVLSDFEGPDWNNKVQPAKSPFVLETSPDRVKEGQSSGKWERLDRNKWIALKNCPTDWSKYEALSFWLCAESANGQKINFTVDVPSTDASQAAAYFLAQIVVDWTGWKHVVIPFAEFRPNRAPKGWSEVRGLNLSSGGWRAVPFPDSVLYLDQMELISR